MLRVRLCRVDELRADTMTAFRVPGVTWPVLAGVFDGELIATAGVCPHEDVSLVGAEVDDTCLTCPGHGYVFDLRTGACLHDHGLVLRRYRARLDGDDVWIELL